MLTLKDTDAGELAVAFGKVETVPDNKFIRYLETDEICLKFGTAAGFFIEEYAGFKASWPQAA
jgi:hypothetical protein